MKPIKNFEGIYAATEDGEIVSMKTGQPIILKGGNQSGYRTYSLRKDGVQSQLLGHRLIAETFIPNPENKPQVNHKDGNKSNNAISNLEWVTKSENSKHAYATGLTKISQEHLELMRKNAGKAKAVFTETDANNICAIYEHMEHKSTRKLAKAYGCSRPTIQRIVNGTIKNFREDAR
jgi:hypothetical protein